MTTVVTNSFKLCHEIKDCPELRVMVLATHPIQEVFQEYDDVIAVFTNDSKYKYEDARQFCIQNGIKHSIMDKTGTRPDILDRIKKLTNTEYF